MRAACVLVSAWAVHLAILPWFTVYTWSLIPAARAFECYLDECCEHWELRHVELATLEHARV